MSEIATIIAMTMGWLAANSPYPNADQIAPPRVVFASAKEINASCATCGSGEALAVYRCSDKTITIPHDAVKRYGMLLDQVLAHELLHHVQCVTWGSIPPARECEAEREAYTVGAKFVIYQMGDHAESRARAAKHIQAIEKACAASRR